MLEFLFHKVADLKACNFIKKRLQHIAKFLRTAFYTEHLWWLLCSMKNLTRIISNKEHINIFFQFKYMAHLTKFIQIYIHQYLLYNSLRDWNKKPYQECQLNLTKFYLIYSKNLGCNFPSFPMSGKECS